MAPPRLSIQSNVTRTKLITSIAVSETTPYKRGTVALNNLFTGSATGYSTVYNECKVRSVRVYFESDRSMADSGLICLVISDYNENSVPSTLNFTGLSTLPGSVVRKNFQPVANMWYPTEPDDRNFHAFSDAWRIFDYAIMINQSSAKLSGLLVFEAMVTLRGRVAQSSAYQVMRRLLSEGEVSDLHHDEMMA